MEKFTEFIKTLAGKRVYIQTHNFPDPDAIASAFGLQALLRHFGVESTLCYHGKIDKLSTRKMTQRLHIELMPYSDLQETMGEDDEIICVDSQKNGGNILDMRGNEVACIDHHPTYKKEEYRYADIRMTGSCATIIAEYFRTLKVPMPEDAATALLYGLEMDTAHFTRGVTPLDIEIFGYLFPLADHETLTDLEKNTMEFTDLRAYGSAIENIRVYDRVGIAVIPFSCPDALIAVISDFILSLEEVRISVIYAYREKELKFSVRSEDPDIHAGTFINRALEGLGNGGGHAEMAGGAVGRENLELLGAYPDAAIRERLFAVLDEMRAEQGQA